MKISKHLLSFRCPACQAKALYDQTRDVYRPGDVDYHDYFVCDECASDFISEPQLNGEVKFVKVRKEINAAKAKLKGEPVEAALVDTPREVIDELIAILYRYGFVLDPAFAGRNPGQTWMGNVHLQVINEDSFVDEYDDNLRKYVPQVMLDAIHELDKRTNCPITYSFGPNRSGQVTGGLDIMKQYVPDDVESATDVQGADYGGAYDIDPQSYFTRDELVEFAESVCTELDRRFTAAEPFEIADVYIELPATLKLSIYDNEWNQYDSTLRIDMRRIRKPADLIQRYLDTVTNDLAKQVEELHSDYDVVGASLDISAMTAESRMDIKDLHDELLNVGAEFLQQQYGYDLGEVADELYIDIVPTDTDTIRVEVRCELSYNGMMALAKVMDPIVQTRDADAYFDMVDSGIMEAFIRK